MQATYDSQYSGVCISPELASRIKKDLGTGTVEALWYEEGRSKSYRDVLQIHNVGVDMVIGKERGTDVEKGRVSIVAPISWKKTSREYCTGTCIRRGDLISTEEKESTRKKQEEARKKASETSADQNRQFLSQQPPSPWEWYDLYSQWHRTVRDNQGESYTFFECSALSFSHYAAIESYRPPPARVGTGSGGRMGME